MKKRTTSRASFVAAAALVASSTAFAGLGDVPSGSYSVDATHAYIDFSYNHLGLSRPSLSFDDFTIDLEFDSENPTDSSVSVVVEAESIEAGSEVWQEHLSGVDFFDMVKYPEITFKSTSIESVGDNNYSVTGELTIKDVTRPLTLDVTINDAMSHPMTGNPVIGFDATGSLLRSEFGMDKFTPAVGDEVQINISAELLAN